MKVVVLALLLPWVAFTATAQTTAQTHCTPTPGGQPGELDCKSTQIQMPVIQGGAMKGIADALNTRREAAPATDYSALDAQRNNRVQRNFGHAQSTLTDLRVNYAAHQKAGDAFPKENLKAFDNSRRDACKWSKFLGNPVPMSLIVSDLDGTPRSCVEAKRFKDGK